MNVLVREEELINIKKMVLNYINLEIVRPKANQN
jgi:hypothetical protein